MENNTNPIKIKCQEIIGGKRQYVKSELAYLRYMMGDIEQKELEECLNTLNMNELKQALAAGVPGKCQHIAVGLLAQYKEKMEAYLMADGNRAHMRLEALDDEGLETSP